MWKRTLLFVGLSSFGALLLAASLLPTNRLEEPRHFDSWMAQQPEIESVAARIDQEFRQHWSALGLQSAPRADDLTIARRLALALTGTIPSLEEIRKLESKSPEERLTWWLAHLTEDRRCSDYLAERLARVYVGTENGPFLVYRRRRFVLWLSDWLRQQHLNGDPYEGYDDLVRHLLADQGLWTDTPSVNYISVTIRNNDGGQPDPVVLAGRTARAMLAVRIDCLQCHDDHLGNVWLGTADQPRSGTQLDFHRLAAFFSQTRNTVSGIQDNGRQPYRYKLLNSDTEETIKPDVPYAPHLRPRHGTLRQQLAEWVTHPDNKPFARAIVNRMWALMFGKPLVQPVDDIPLYPEFAPGGSYPPGLETLAEDFVQHEYNLFRLIRVIAATQVFQMESRAPFEVTPEHEQHWAVFPLTRLRPEQMAGSLIQSTSLTTIDANAHIFAQLQRYFEQQEFVRRYGDLGQDEFADSGGTIPQRLLMMNGNLPHRRTQAQPLITNAVSQIAALAPDDKTAVETAYLAVLTRRPTPDEAAHFADRLRDARRRQRMRVLEDLYWVLLNSTEFSWNH